MFAKPKNNLEKREQVVTTSADNSRTETAHATAASTAVSTLGPGMMIKGSIVCEGPMQVFGRIFGEIHAVKLSIGEGGQVEGQVTAEETTIAGHFKGTIHSKSVRLESTAVVEGEIYKNALVIDQDAQFEGLTRRLEKSLELPSVSAQTGASNSLGNGVTNGSSNGIDVPYASS
jgi:cytoskeletal protein CcmA (bactofilin family)